jgi:hypothetical protein
MKNGLLILAFFFLSLNIFAQEKDYIYQLGDVKLGGYVGTSLKYTSFENKPAGFMDFKAAVTINSRWAVGVGVSGLYYDKSLSALVDDGTYHVYANYSSLFVERMIPLNDELILSLSITSGQGEVYYQYDRDFRGDKLWSEEIIDKTTFWVFEPGIELQYNVGGNFWLGMTGSYRSTSPIELLGASEDMLKQFNGGLTFKWGIF